MKMKSLVASLAAGLAGGAFAQAQSGPVRIGFITDMSSVIRRLDGPGGSR